MHDLMNLEQVTTFIPVLSDISFYKLDSNTSVPPVTGVRLSPKGFGVLTVVSINVRGGKQEIFRFLNFWTVVHLFCNPCGVICLHYCSSLFAYFMLMIFSVEVITDHRTPAAVNGDILQ